MAERSTPNSGRKAVVLLSGGLDSATTLYAAHRQGYVPHCLIFRYGQRHQKETRQAVAVARTAGCGYQILKIILPWQGSSLLNKKSPLPRREKIDLQEIPSTYVPGRNIIFLSFAVSYAEAIGASAVFIGANAIDYSGYPDCRPEFFQSFQETLRRGTKAGVNGKAIKILTPLVNLTKAQIIRLGMKLGVPYELTWSCYQGGRKPCGTCDSCVLRKKGFAAVGMADPAG
ncbi:MAG: 7-cyano-7-deazaguanine synthase QueC [Candidatus Omnitrophica bacterium]|nr:7-cyano-7-deazaguanine synthase QueC [Candidatus Omnitrophota bacterium]